MKSRTKLRKMDKLRSSPGNKPNRASKKKSASRQNASGIGAKDYMRRAQDERRYDGETSKAVNVLCIQIKSGDGRTFARKLGPGSPIG